MLVLVASGALLAWLKFSAKRAAFQRRTSLAPLTRKVLEPVLTTTEVVGEFLPYRPVPIMTACEQDLFDRLKAALPECEIFPQTPLASFIKIDRKRAGQRYFTQSYRWQNRIGQQRVDFLVCRQTDMATLAAIELDDPSHGNHDAMRRDDKKNKSLEAAGIPLIRWRVEFMPTPEQIRQAFLQAGLLK